MPLDPWERALYKCLIIIIIIIIIIITITIIIYQNGMLMAAGEVFNIVEVWNPGLVCCHGDKIVTAENQPFQIQSWLRYISSPYLIKNWLSL